MNGWTEDDATDVRTRDLARRHDDIMGGLGKPYGITEWKVQDIPKDVSERQMDGYRYAIRQAHPRRIDWLRVAALTGVTLAACAAAAALIVGLAYFFTYPW